ncbi:zinc finger protein 260-like isoform X2 [Ostrinia furnacalis]|uniref:zinc finger protein 260-like isoform X2 n=1 Tax=Ostrinia furnacalis TaxID=93504 RepID=UPI0010397A03|nr:zinc finger protein 260-like isoform X2 [Ostrinia furnacalis]
MRCSVQNCSNDTRRKTKTNGLTFHVFPREPQLRHAWIEALGMSEWEPKDRSTVCSEHFRNSDFYETKCGLRRIKNGAVPVLGLGSDDLDAPASLRVCRICLSMGVKMYDMFDYQLGEIYQQLTDTEWSDKDELPQKLCWECAARLASCAKMRSRALRSHKLMMDVLNSTSPITVKDVKSISRSTYELQSSLIQKVYEPNECDMYWQETCEPSLPVFLAEEKEENIKAESPVGCAASPLPELPPSVQVKDESTEIYFDEFNDNTDQFQDHFNESDDNVKLSEVAEKPKVKKKKVKIEKEKKPKERKKKDDEENPVETMDKYKTSDVKRRKTVDGPDESLFNISTLTYEEQIAEIQKRQESTAYKTAPYKCVICFRGFLVAERYNAHAVRHSEQCGAYECFICKTRLKTSRALRKHLTAQHTEKFSCKGCPFVTRNRGVAREHEKWHAGARYQCPHCPSEFDKLTTYMGHIRIKHVSDFVCELCGFTFVSKKGIEVHKKKKHRLSDKTVPLEGPYCCVCDVTFVSEDAHARHLKLSSKHSSDNDPNRIRNDSQSINTERNGRVMRKIERRPVIHAPSPAQPAGAGPVTCEQCGVQLRDLRLYAQHFRRAHPDKNRTKYPAMKTPCMCEQCGRIFQSMALLKDHMWVHTGEKRFKCDRCEKSFTQKTNLVFHMRVHGASRPTYECPLCGKHFAFYNNRRRHMFIHTGLKPFKCETCGKCFTTAGEQRAHVEHVHLKKPWPKRARGQRGPRDPAPWQKGPLHED